MTQALFPRSFRETYPDAVRGEGCFIYTADGEQYLDAVGGAAVVGIGHGVESVSRAMAEQALQLAFVHTSQFHTEVAERLAQRLRALAPPAFHNSGVVYFTSGGSEAAETALKLCRQYFLERGEPQRVRIVSRSQSYHGSTLGALCISGNVHRRAPYQPWLHEWGHIAPCYCYRCPFGLSYPSCDLACADDLEKYIEQTGPETIAAFIFEPISGATLGAAPPPETYAPRIAEICRRYGILLIADEVMTGMGRSGKPFAVEHWGVEPDLILVGKGIASGYAPLGAVIVRGEVAEAIAQGSGAFEHGFTYSAHPVAMAASNAVLDYIEEHNLFERVTPAGAELKSALSPLLDSQHVGDIRGLGLLLGIEFVSDRETREPFPRSARIAEQIRDAARAAGVITYPIQGCVDGERGDHILVAPPYIVSSGEIGIIAQALQSAVASLS